MKYLNPLWQWLKRNIKLVIIIIGLLSAEYELYNLIFCFYVFKSMETSASIFSFVLLIILFINVIVGFIIKKKTGWVFIASILYFLVIVIFCWIISDKLAELNEAYTEISIFLLLLISIVFINQKEFKKVFKIEHEKSLYKLNIVAFSLMSLLACWLLFNN